MKFFLQLNILAVFLSLCAGAWGAQYPVKISSANPRILVDQTNAPFLLVGDAPQSLLVNLNQGQVALYLADRATNGFNSIWVQLLCGPYIGGRANESLLNGTVPFTNKIGGTTNYDLTTPNEAYFAYLDTVIRMAATNGIQVMLDPLDTGGLIQTALDNGSNNCRAYGQYLGNRYKNFPNLIWLNGNDFQNWTDAAADTVVIAIAQGIKDNDTNHLQTVELSYFLSASLDDSNWNSLVGLNLAYTYYPTYDEVLHGYQQSANTPVFLGEEHYEFESVGGSAAEMGTPLVLRHQEYWTLLSGGAGQVYGNSYTWLFKPGWQSHLDSTGVAELQYATALFTSRAWYNLMPDTNNMVLVSGFGTYATNGLVSTNDYATCAYTDDGTLALAYLPSGNIVTMNLDALSGAITAQWYDPASGTYSPIDGSPFTNAGMQTFTPPGYNSDGDPDWVLVLDGISDSTGIFPAMTNPPTLFINLTDTNSVVIVWPGYLLQQKFNLSTTNWIDVTNAILDDGSEYEVVIPSAKGQQFYRLQSDLVVPPLNIFQTATNSLVATWTGYLLQQNSDLTTTNWVNVTNTITVVGSQYQAVILPLASQQFYRLQNF